LPLKDWIVWVMGAETKDAKESVAESRRVDALKYLSSAHRSQFDIRQKLEWRVVFTAFTFYILVPSAVYADRISIPRELWCWVVLVYLAFWWIIFSFLKRLQESHNVNKAAAELAEDHLWKSVGLEPSDIFVRQKLENRRHDYVWKRAREFFVLQVLMLTFFALISCISVTFLAESIRPGNAKQTSGADRQPAKDSATAR